MKTYADSLLADRYIQAVLKAKVPVPLLHQVAELLVVADLQREKIKGKAMTDEHLCQVAREIERAIRAA